MSNDIWVWIGAFLTLGTYSILFKDNPVYRVLEALFVAILAGHSVVINWYNFQKPTLTGRLGEGKEWTLIIPLFLAALMYFRYSRKYAWLARYPMAFLMGIGAAYVLTKNLKLCSWLKPGLQCSLCGCPAILVRPSTTGL